VVWVGIVAHAGFVPLFVWLGHPWLAAFNVASVALWVLAGAANRRGRGTTAMWILVAEVVAHALLAVLTLGWASGFQYYLIPLIPFVMFNERLRGTWALAVALLLLLAFVLLHAVAPAGMLPEHVNPALSTLNIVIPLAALGLVSYNFRLASMDVERTVAEMAATDPLTGLFNRRHMNQRLREEESRAARTGGRFCVILADIDHFKRINDDFGHDAGDRVLMELARLFRQTLRTQDIVARWGGEEFLVVLPETELAAAHEAAERLRVASKAELGRPLPSSVEITLTLGVAEYQGSLEECLKVADQALYTGKKRGRDQVVLGSSPDRQAHVVP